MTTRRDRADARRARSAPVRRRIVGICLAGLGAGTVLVNAVSGSPVQIPMTRVSFSTTRTGTWFDDSALGTTAGSDQYAQAQVSGLSDGDHEAGFAMRADDRGGRVVVAVSGLGWDVEPSGAPALHGSFPHSPDGLFRVEMLGQAVRVLWDGQMITSQPLQAQYPGRGVVATIWQSSPTVRMTDLQASTLTADDLGGAGFAGAGPDGAAASPSGAGPGSASGPGGASTSSPPGASPSPSRTSRQPAAGLSPAARRGWLSGASGTDMADGGFDRWRGTAATIAGTWDDTDPTVQQELYSICGGQYSLGQWNRALDLAIGAIFEDQGETWAAAANGAYNARWRAVLTTAKQCWGNRDPHLLFLRFGHEMNLSSSNWGVQAGQEGDFTRALVQFSNIRYQVFPGVRLVLSVNDGSSAGMADVRKLFPGRDAQGRPVVDVYGVDSYNAYPHCTSVSDCTSKFDAYDQDGAPLGIERHRELAQQMGVPFSIDEYANNAGGGGGGGGESPAFFEAFYNWARAHSGNVNDPAPGQLLYEILFNDSGWSQYDLWPTTEQPASAAAYRSLAWGVG